MSERAVFLDRVRAALGVRGRRTHEPVPPAPDDDLLRLSRPGADLVERFAAKAEAGGMHVHRATPEDMAGTLRSVLESIGARAVTMSVRPESADALAGAVRATGVTVVDASAAAGLDAHYDVDAGITDVDAAIAETGSIVVTSDAARSRGTFLVPPVHVAIVRADQVRPDLIDYWSQRRQAPAAWPAAVVLVSGPSKTGDIEGILVTGVHGPREVHVVLSGEATKRRSDEATKGAGGRR